MIREQPKYTIQTAARRTGLSPFILRAWEKRYGVPRPSRSRSRYRYYSDGDLDEIRWMTARVADGIPPRQAARLVHERRKAGGTFTDAPQALEPASLVSDLRASCLAFDDEHAQAVIRRASTVMPPIEVVRRVLLPTVAAVGDDYLSGVATVAQEHFASQIARRFTLRIMDLYPAHAGAPVVLLACAPGEQHELGLLALAADVCGHGFQVIYLGPAVPVEALLATIRSQRPAAAVVAVVLKRHLQRLVAQRDEIRRVTDDLGTAVVWGGPGARLALQRGLPGRVALTIDAVLQYLGFSSNSG